MKFKTFVLGLAATFALPWFFLLVVPSMHFDGLEPVPYDEDQDEMTGSFPAILSGNQRQGLRVYMEQGCAQCHSQLIRPTYAGWDSFKKGWGTEPSPDGAVYTRHTTPWDYLNEPYAPLGVRRSGGDLSNVGSRYSDPAVLHQKLYAPRSVHQWSTMPRFRNLYETREIFGQPSEEALVLEGDYAPEEGHEVVPTGDAKVLVSYLLALKKSEKIPASLAAQVGSTSGPPAPAAAAPAAAPAPPAPEGGAQ